MSDTRVSRLLMMALGLSLCGALAAAQNLEVESRSPARRPRPRPRPGADASEASRRRRTRHRVLPPRRPRGEPSMIAEGGVRELRCRTDLQVILHVDRKLPIVHVNQWYRRLEERAERAHRLRAPVRAHDVQGSKNATGEYFSYVERAGANLQEGGVNGTTSSDRTNYFATVPSGNLENILWLESDRLATLLDATDIRSSITSATS